MLQRPSSSFSQTAPFIYTFKKQTNIVPISSLNHSISHFGCRSFSLSSSRLSSVVQFKLADIG
ncbi:unnamed protein product, partial [Rotaria magnacalcarata]